MGKKKQPNAYEKELIGRYEEHRQGNFNNDFTEDEIIELYNFFYGKHQDIQKSKELLNWSLSIYPNSDTLYNLQAVLNFETQNYSSVINSLKKSLKINPYNSETWLYLYEVFLNAEFETDEDFFWGKKGFKNYLPEKEIPKFYNNLIELLESYEEYEKVLFLYFVLIEINPHQKYIPKLLFYTDKFKSYPQLQIILEQQTSKYPYEEYLWRALAFTYYCNKETKAFNKALFFADTLSNLHNNGQRLSLNLNIKFILTQTNTEIYKFLYALCQIYHINSEERSILQGLDLLNNKAFKACQQILIPCLSQKPKYLEIILNIILSTYEKLCENERMLALLDKYKNNLSPKNYLYLLNDIIKIYQKQSNYEYISLCYMRLLDQVKNTRLREKYYKTLINNLIINKSYAQAYTQIQIARTEFSKTIFNLYPIAIEIIAGQHDLTSYVSSYTPMQLRLLKQILRTCNYM